MNLSPFVVPLGAFVMVVLIVAIASMKKMREKELEAHEQLRTQEMEHERKMKELDIEKAKDRTGESARHQERLKQKPGAAQAQRARGGRRSMDINPLWIPIVAVIFGTAMIVAIVAIVHWFKARDKELQYHQELRIREMEHQRKMKELEIEMEKAKGHDTANKPA